MRCVITLKDNSGQVFEYKEPELTGCFYRIVAPNLAQLELTKASSLESSLEQVAMIVSQQENVQVELYSVEDDLIRIFDAKFNGYMIFESQEGKAIERLALDVVKLH